MKHLLLFSAFCYCLVFNNGANAQFVCGFDQLHQQRMQTDAGYRNAVNTFERKLQQARKLPSAAFRDSIHVLPDTIPVVIHIIHTGEAIGTTNNPSDSIIQAVIDYTNQVYAGTYPGITGAGDIGIRFALAKRDPFCNPTNGIDRVDGSGIPLYLSKGLNYEGNPGLGATAGQLTDLTKWDPYRYYNIWVVTSISSAVAAFAYYPTDPATDGIFIGAYFLWPGNYVLPHELGHAFFLYHVFEGAYGSQCPVNNDCSLDGDHICDTDPVTSGADTTANNPCNNKPYSDNTEKNFMNYVFNPSLFTAGQKERMQQTLFNNILRDTLTKSTARFAVDAAPACNFVLQLNGTLIQNDILLNWKNTGLNANGFQLQRSYDGINFLPVGFIAYNPGNSQYSFHDADISQARNFYRLHQLLFDGKEIYSNTVIINYPLVSSNQFQLLNNPVDNYIDMQFGTFQSDPGTDYYYTQSHAEVRLLDLSGKLISRFSATVNPLQRLRIPVSNVPAGIYVLQVVRNNTLYVKKILKSRARLF